MNDVAVILLPVFTTFVAHFLAANIYANVCTPLSVSGIMQSLILTASPVCSTVLTVINYTQHAYGGLILGVGAYFVKVITWR